RIFIEFFRLPDAHIGYLFGDWLTLGQVLTLPMMIIGFWIIISHKLKVK
ncbi:MAG: prolipoprotein diacylglyceryl transferase, partial [Gammaproteobacteria bacterium]|nr:prolipoprotein diacylglyceryl transferase [Gammaproteobacteria bacterium]